MNNIQVDSDAIKNIQPHGNKLFVEYELPEEKTSSGILLKLDSTDKAQKNYVGKVIAVGSNVPPMFVPGARILFSKGRQYDFHFKPDAETNGFPSHCFVSWYDILAIIEGEGTVRVN